jgi:2-aminoethylphosphonate transport system permease protein
LPLLVLATLFFYPLLLIAEQALRDASGNLGLETFWQVMDSKRFIGALLNTLQIAVSRHQAACCSAACWR